MTHFCWKRNAFSRVFRTMRRINFFTTSNRATRPMPVRVSWPRTVRYGRRGFSRNSHPVRSRRRERSNEPRAKRRCREETTRRVAERFSHGGTFRARPLRAPEPDSTAARRTHAFGRRSRVSFIPEDSRSSTPESIIHDRHGGSWDTRVCTYAPGDARTRDA